MVSAKFNIDKDGSLLNVCPVASVTSTFASSTPTSTAATTSSTPAASSASPTSLTSSTSSVSPIYLASFSSPTSLTTQASLISVNSAVLAMEGAEEDLAGEALSSDSSSVEEEAV